MKRTVRLAAAFALAAAAASAAPYAKTMSVTVPGVPQDVTLVDFPLLVRLSAGIQGFSYSDFQSDDGSDLRFELANGGSLPYEVDTWNTNGESLVWVKVPQLTRTTVVTALWGSDEPGSNDPKAVWSNYVGVWHFNDTTNSVSDSYPVYRLPTSSANWAVSMDETNHLGASYRNVSTADGVRFKLGTSTSNPLAELSSLSRFSMSMWAKPTNTTTPSVRLFSNKEAHGDNGFEYLAISGSGLMLRGNGTGNQCGYWAGGYQALKDKSWAHQAFKIDGTSATIFSNGESYSGTVAAPTVAGAYGVAVGGFPHDTNKYTSLVGFADEVRIYNGVPADEYLVAEYAQVATSGYVEYGEVQDFASDVAFVSADSAVAADEGFTAYGRLTEIGSTSPEVFLDWSADGGQTWSSASLGSFSATGPLSHTVGGLSAAATYAWRFRAVGSATRVSDTKFVTLTGRPALGEPTAAVDGNAATLSVSLVSPGLSGTAQTTVELWLAEAGGPLALRKAFAGVTAAADFSETLSGLDWGVTYDYAFRATVPYSPAAIESWTATNAFKIAGTLLWTAGAGTTDWHTADNWSPAVVPSPLLDAQFGAVGGSVTAAADGEVAVLRVDTPGEGAAFDFNGHSLTGGYLAVGTASGAARATLLDGRYAFVSNRVGEVNCQGSTLAVGAGAVLSGNSLVVGFDDDLTATSNAVVFASGSATRLTGALHLRAARGTRADVEPGASLTVNGLQLIACGDEMVVDGGALTNNGATTLFLYNGRGLLADTMYLELRNGAVAKMKGKVYVNAGRNNPGERCHAELRVLGGSVFDATDGDLHIDSNSAETGPNADVGSGAAVVVSNSTMKVKALNVCVDDRHTGDELRIYEDPGEEAEVSVVSGCRISSGSWTRAGNCNRGHRILVEGGKFAVGTILHVGDGGEYYEAHDDNRLEIRRASARVTAKNLAVYGKGYIDVKIPEGGFAQVPVQVTETAAFGAVPVTGDNKVPMYEEGEYTPATEIRVDVTDFLGRQTLLTAGSITGLAADRVVVTAGKSKRAKVTLTDTSLTVSASLSGLSVILR